MSVASSRVRALLLFAFTGLCLATTSALAQDGTWTRAPELRGLEAGCLVRDTAHDRLVLFGGSRYGFPTNEVYVSPAGGTPDWQLLKTAGSPPPARFYAAAVYDPIRQRLLMLGGRDRKGSVSPTLWSLSLAGPGTPAWSALTPSGIAPTPGSEARMFYDAARDRVLLLPGIGGQGFGLWALSLADPMTWTQLIAPDATTGLNGVQEAVLDSLGNEVVVIGATGSTTRVGVFPLTDPMVWTFVPTIGTPPVPVSLARAAIDPVRRQVLFVGGQMTGSQTVQTWNLSLAGPFAWTAVAQAGAAPSARWASHLLFDAARDRMVLFGGGTSMPGDTTFHPEGFDDTWALPTAVSSQWQQLSPGSFRPGQILDGHTLTYDSRRSRLVVIGGVGSNGIRGDVVTWSTEHGGRWERQTTHGASFPARYFHTATYDVARDRIIVIGGQGSSGALSDVWELQLATMTWAQITPTGAPRVPLVMHSAMLDVARERILVYRGRGIVDQLSLTGTPVWSPVLTQGPSLGSTDYSAAFLDPVRDRMIVTGGYYSAGPFGEVSDQTATWALSLSSPPTWSSLASGPGLTRQAVVYDPPRDRMIVYGGGGHVTFTDQLNGTLTASSTAWAYSLATGTWRQLSATDRPRRRWSTGAVYDPIHDGLYVFGGDSDNADGNDYEVTNSDLFQLRFVATLDAPPDPIAVPSVLEARAYPNPAHAGVSVRFALPQRGVTTVRIFDAQGRVVRTLVDEVRAAGTHVITWDALDERGARARTGLYFVEVRSGGARRVERLALLE